MKPEPKRFLILGATSTIAIAVAEHYAAVGSVFFLVGRNEEQLVSVGNDLRGKGAQVAGIYVADLRLKDVHDEIINTAKTALGTIDLVLIAHGIMPLQTDDGHDVDTVLDVMVTNAMSPISLAHRVGDVLAEQGSGTLAVLSSVAGDRGRRGNAAYGAAKAALSAYAAALRGRLIEQGVHVLTIKPGPVRTPLMAGKSVPIVASLEPVARDIVRAIERRALILYTPWYWRLLMIVFKLLPERIAMRLKI